MKYQSVFRPGLFAGRTIIVTGGDSGLGRCTAHELASPGATIALVSRKIDKRNTVRAEIIAAGGQASCPMATFVTKPWSSPW
ncbi:SDR family NAD(P)-dependent oxidoreductase [Rugosibacter aromaticivorans]|uniref:SDR family NAD(P)-dependent oxidoreductase n=1 Tax=Rugosibacter aromaticivorans TaxID=1565605 RepID=UPI000AC35280